MVQAKNWMVVRLTPAYAIALLLMDRPRDSRGRLRSVLISPYTHGRRK